MTRGYPGDTTIIMNLYYLQSLSQTKLYYYIERFPLPSHGKYSAEIWDNSYVQCCPCCKRYNALYFKVSLHTKTILYMDPGAKWCWQASFCVLMLFLYISGSSSVLVYSVLVYSVLVFSVLVLL